MDFMPREDVMGADSGATWKPRKREEEDDSVEDDSDEDNGEEF